MRVLAHLQRLARFVADRRGVSAVEFALVLPVMVPLYLGLVELTQGISIDRKVTLTARTVADLASRVSSIRNDDMTNMLKATEAVITPYDKSKLKVVVSAIAIDNAGTAKIAWSDALNASRRAKDSAVTLPDPVLKVPNTMLIWSEVSYDYTPNIGGPITGTLHLTEQMYMRPRLSDTITRLDS